MFVCLVILIWACSISLVLAHAVDEAVVEKIAQAYPTDKDGKEVDITPLVVPSHQYARRINEYMVARQQRMTSRSKGGAKASSTSTAAGARGSDE